VLTIRPKSGETIASSAIADLNFSLEIQAIQASGCRALLDRHGAVQGDHLHFPTVALIFRLVWP